MKDKLFEMWLESLSPRTAATYRYGVIAYCEYTGKTCSELIKEAQKDYIKKVAPWDLTHIKQFEGFIQKIKNDMDISNWGKLSFINAVRHFYRHNKIPVEGISKPNIPAMATEKYLDLPQLTLEDVRKAVLACGVDEKLTKALILTFLSSGQAQAEIRKLEGRHLKNVVSGIAIVNMTRCKTNRRYLFYIGQEALAAIHEYKPELKDTDLVFTQKYSNKPLNNTYIGTIFKRMAEKLGWQRSYFQPHRFRHYFKSQLSGSMDNIFIEYLLGHNLAGVESNYFLGNDAKMLEAYLKNQQLLTVFQEKEVLQKTLDELVTKDRLENELLRAESQQMRRRLDELETTKAEMKAAMEKIQAREKMWDTLWAERVKAGEKKLKWVEFDEKGIGDGELTIVDRIKYPDPDTPLVKPSPLNKSPAKLKS